MEKYLQELKQALISYKGSRIIFEQSNLPGYITATFIVTTDEDITYSCNSLDRDTIGVFSTLAYKIENKMFTRSNTWGKHATNSSIS